MARTTKKASQKRGKAKPAKSSPTKKSRPARKAVPRKTPKKIRKTAKPKASPKLAPLKHDAAHERHMEAIRRQVARHRPGSAPDDVLHEQKDPSIVAHSQPPAAPVDALRQNWGDTKQKAVTRLDKPTNWFRQAPKQPSK